MPQSQPPSLRKRFQSAPSVGWATTAVALTSSNVYISIHALRGEGDEYSFDDYDDDDISIHALREEGDVERCINTVVNKAFQSTPSVVRATKLIQDAYICGYISIHALRGEGDQSILSPRSSQSYFNPRPPWGGRLSRIFLSTPSYCYFNPRPPWGGRQQRRIYQT